MIVIRLQPFMVAAIALFVVGLGLIVGGDIYRHTWILLSHVGLAIAGAGTASVVVAWFEKRIASAEQAFVIGARLCDEDRHLRPL